MSISITDFCEAACAAHSDTAHSRLDHRHVPAESVTGAPAPS